MQVTELSSSGLQRNYKIVVEAAEINAQMETELRAAGERVNIPGFRPGFIPMKILQQRYGKSVQADVLKQAINKATTDMVRERKLRPALTPQINIEEYNDGGELSFTVSFESFPDTPDVDFSKITLNRKIFDISEKDIDEASERIAERSPTLVPAKDNAKAELGQVVTIDFKGMIDGVPFAGGSASDFKLELGSHQFIEGFEEQLVGVKKGDDVIVKATFPKDYPGEEVAGKEASFAVTVKAIENKQTPEITDAFAKERGFEDLAKLRDAIRAQLVKEYDQVVRNQLKKELFDILEEEYDFDLPQGMVDLEFNSIWERLKQAQAAGDESVAGKSEDELREDYQKIARRRVKLGLLLADIGNRNKIQITREELTRAIMQQASMYPGQEKKVMEFYRNNPDRVEDLRGPILEEKAVDFVLSKITFNDSTVTLDELVDEEEGDETEGAEKKKPAKSAKPARKAEDASEKSGEEAPKKGTARKKAAGTKE